MLYNKVTLLCIQKHKDCSSYCNKGNSHKFGRPTDGLKSLVQTRIVLATLPSPAGTKEFSERQVGALLGLPPSTYKGAVKGIRPRTAILEGVHIIPKSDIFQGSSQESNGENVG